MQKYSSEMLIGLFFILSAVFHSVDDPFDVIFIPILFVFGTIQFINGFFNWRGIYNKDIYWIAVNAALILILMYFYRSPDFSAVYISGMTYLYILAGVFILISILSYYEFTRRMEKYQKVIEYDKILKMGPGDAQLWNNRGIALEELEDLKGAARSYEKAVEIDPSYVKAWYNRGNVLSKMKNYQIAVESYKKALELDPENIKALNNMGNTFVSIKKYAEAVNSYEQVSRIDPENFKAIYNRGYALEMMDMHNEALESYEHALELKPEDPESWYRKGVVLEDMGEKYEASSCYDTALNLKPDFKDAKHARNELQYQ